MAFCSSTARVGRDIDASPERVSECLNEFVSRHLADRHVDKRAYWQLQLQVQVNHIILYVIILDVFMKKHGLWCWFQDLGSFWSVNQVCECPCRLYSLWTLWSMGPLVILPMGFTSWEAVLTSLQRYIEVNITFFNLQLGGSSMDMTHYLDWNKFLIQDSCSPAFMQIISDHASDSWNCM